MDKAFQYIHRVFGMFTKIATWTLIATACFITVFWGTDTELKVGLLWQMLGLAFLCAVGCSLLWAWADSERATKRGMLLKMALAYLFVIVTIAGGGLYFEWFYLSDWKMVLGMFIFITLGYLLIGTLSICAAKKEADRMNRKLRERRQGS